MRQQNSRYRRLLGVFAAVEGLAMWILAIFGSSYARFGLITWPETDFYGTALGTMRLWLASPSIRLPELFGYLGLAIAIIGPLWFWICHPLVLRASEWKESVIWVGPGSEFWTDSAEDVSNTTLDDSPTRADTGFDSVEEALANGDFFRGSNANGQRSEDDGAEHRWHLGGPE